MASSAEKRNVQKSRSSSGRSQSSGRKPAPKKAGAGRKSSSASEQAEYRAILVLTVTGALMIFFFLCSLGLFGDFGGVTADLLFGIFGVTQYVMPVLVMLGVIFLIKEHAGGYIVRKVTWGALFLLSFQGLCHILVHRTWGMERLGQSFVYSRDHHTAGGILGALFSSLFQSFAGPGLTTAILVILCLVFLILFCGRSMLDFARWLKILYSEDDEERQAKQELRDLKLQRRNSRALEQQQIRKQKTIRAREDEKERIARLDERRRQRQEVMSSVSRNVPDIKLPGFDQNPQGKLKDSGLVMDEPGEGKDIAILKDPGFRSDTDDETPQFMPTSGFSEDSSGVGEAPSDKILNVSGKSTDNRKKRSVKSASVTVSEDGELHIHDSVMPGEDPMKRSSESLVSTRAQMVHEDDIRIHGIDERDDPAAQHSAVSGSESEPYSEGGSRTETYVSPAKHEESSVLSGAAAAKKKSSPLETESAVSNHPLKPAVSSDSVKSVSGAGKPDLSGKPDTLKNGAAKTPQKEYIFPDLSLLNPGKQVKGNSRKELAQTARKLESTLDSFGVHVKVTDVSCGPAVTRYEMLPEQGTRVSKITGLSDDIKLAMAVPEIRIEAPIPGKSAIGIEVPNSEPSTVAFRDLLEDQDRAFFKARSPLTFAVGKDIGGNVVISDIAKMPHVLIAGATGSGKSVCINTLIMSILYKARPDEVKLIMIDPKVVELSVYNGIPHLLIPVVTDPKKASGALNWAVSEMEDRYKLLAKYGVRKIDEYNDKVEDMLRHGEKTPEGEDPEKMPKIVIIVDELADLMMVAHGEVEDAIVRLSQLARAAGIHLVIATQRPSVDVITGLIKANVPSRIAFAVSSGVDSRTILDMSGAEKLLGRGDMLFAPGGSPKPLRVQGAFVSDSEIERVVNFLKENDPDDGYDESITEKITSTSSESDNQEEDTSRDSYFVDAAKFAVSQAEKTGKGTVSTGSLQRRFKIGFNRAARILDQLALAGVVGESEGTKPREVRMSPEELENALEQGEL